jgi:hypothetical protein
MLDNEDTPLVEPNLADTLTASERALRDQYVREYLIDYDALAATTRVGYRASMAKEYSIRLMQDPYVLQQIRLKQAADEDETPEVMKKRIMAGLIRESNYRGPGCSQAARVAALAKLASIHGMDAPTRTKTELTGADGQPLGAGTFVIPGIMSPEQWAVIAEAQQAALVANTGTTQETKQPGND